MGACTRRAGLISRIGELRHNTIVILAGEWTAKIRGGPMNERRVKRIICPFEKGQSHGRGVF